MGKRLSFGIVRNVGHSLYHNTFLVSLGHDNYSKPDLQWTQCGAAVMAKVGYSLVNTRRSKREQIEAFGIVWVPSDLLQSHHLFLEEENILRFNVIDRGLREPLLVSCCHGNNLDITTIFCKHSIHLRTFLSYVCVQLGHAGQLK